MNFEKAWTITRKDLSIFWKKPSLLYSLVAFPMAIGVGLPAVIWLVHRRDQVSYAALAPIFDAFLFFFAVATVLLSTALSAYSIVGEKVERSLEPLLATPTSDGEILLGKGLGAFIPTIVSTMLGTALLTGLIDALTYGSLGYLYFPNWPMVAYVALVIPLTCLCSVEANVLVSSRVSDVRGAQQAGGLIVIPFAGLYVAAEIGAVRLDVPFLLEMSAVLSLLNGALFFLARSTFRREEILTRWK